MWKLNENGNWSDFDGEHLRAALIHYIPERDGHPCERWGVEIRTSGDDGLKTVGYIKAAVFQPELAQAIAAAALRENQDFAWWLENAQAWWDANTVYAQGVQAQQREATQ